MNEEELSLKVQKNWIRIKHETQHIREKIMDKLLEEGAVTLDEMKDIRSKAKENQFDFLLYRLIESRKCKVLLRVLEMYGRRPLCVAIRKTELTTEDFNTTTQTKLREVNQRSADVHIHSLSKELTDFHTEIGETVTNLNHHMDEMGQRMEILDTRVDGMASKKKVVKKKGGVVNIKGPRAGGSLKSAEERERLRKLVSVKSSEVVKLKAQVQAKSEEIKWLNMQLENKESSGKSLAATLEKTKNEKLAFQQRLYESKKEQLDLSNQLLANEEITRDLRERIRAVEEEMVGLTNEKHASLNEKPVDVYEEKPLSIMKKKRVTFKPDHETSHHVGSQIHELARALEAVLEEREYVNKLIRLKNAETLELTVYLRAKTDENDRLLKDAQEMASPRFEIRDRLERNDFEIDKTKEKLSVYMHEIEELSKKLKPISLKEKEITSKLRELEKGC